MSEWSSFFNSYKGDRTYTAAQFVEYFANFIGNGIFSGGNSLKVEASGGNMDIKVLEGKGFINGYYYINREAPKTLTLEESGLTLPRIDRVVLRLDLSQSTRWIQAVVKTGIPANTPAAPGLQRDNAAWELGLADIRINASVKEVQQSNITDLRLNTSMCGVVAALITQPDLTNIFNQYQSYLDTKIAEWNFTQAGQQKEYETQRDSIGGWYNAVKNNIVKLQSYSFDNIAALYVASRTTKFSGNAITETIVDTYDQRPIAERSTTIYTDGSITEITKVFTEDGVSIMKQATITTIFNADGSIKETVKGFDDYAFGTDNGTGVNLEGVSYTNPDYPEISTVGEALDVALKVPEIISWNTNN